MAKTFVVCLALIVRCAIISSFPIILLTLLTRLLLRQRNHATLCCVFSPIYLLAVLVNFQQIVG